MMSLTKISSKNQITLPVAMMKAIGLDKGEEILLSYKDNNIIMEPCRKSIIDEIGGSLTKHVKPKLLKLSYEEIKRKADDSMIKHLVKKYEKISS
jgi:bifunctional DNA-binding transcriptional regulator/antitoxin component of YhaV-PrlF toxin-antitoxin module